MNPRRVLTLVAGVTRVLAMSVTPAAAHFNVPAGKGVGTPMQGHVEGASGLGHIGAECGAEAVDPFPLVALGLGCPAPRRPHSERPSARRRGTLPRRPGWAGSATAGGTMTDLYWDPFTPSLRDDPYPLWKRLRDEAPVYYNDRYDFWALSQFHDIEAAHKAPDVFSSAHGTTIEMMSPEPVDTGMMIWTDPPKHTLLRKLVSRAFTARRMASLEDRIRDVTSQLLDAQVGRSTFDYVQDFGAILPPTIISSLLGVPEQDQERMRHVIDDIFHIEDDVGMMNDISMNARSTLNDYLASQFADRRRNPRDDMFTDLVQAEVSEDGDERRLGESELLDFGTVIFVAGTETVARHLGWVADVLDQHPGQRAELANDFSLIPNAIEEILRYEPPSPVNARWTTRDVILHGQTIPASSRVVLLTGSAGRDERKYENPDTVDIHREIDHHLTFGYGIHFCLGAALARMEGRIGLEETLKRWPEWTVDRANAVPLYTSTVRGYLNLPIAV